MTQIRPGLSLFSEKEVAGREGVGDTECQKGYETEALCGFSDFNSSNETSSRDGRHHLDLLACQSKIFDLIKVFFRFSPVLFFVPLSNTKKQTRVSTRKGQPIFWPWPASQTFPIGNLSEREKERESGNGNAAMAMAPVL